MNKKLKPGSIVLIIVTVAAIAVLIASAFSTGALGSIWTQIGAVIVAIGTGAKIVHDVLKLGKSMVDTDPKPGDGEGPSDSVADKPAIKTGTIESKRDTTVEDETGRGIETGDIKSGQDSKITSKKA